MRYLEFMVKNKQMMDSREQGITHDVGQLVFARKWFFKKGIGLNWRIGEEYRKHYDEGERTRTSRREPRKETEAER